MIAVTGASGGLGGRVAAGLAELGSRQRLLVRDPSRAPQLTGADVAAMTYADGPAVRLALQGADTLFLVSAAEAPDRVAQHITAVDAAVEAGIQRIVYTSFLGASADNTFLLGRHHAATEEHIRATGVAHTFLRDSLYIDFLPSMCGADGVIRGPAGSGRFYPVTRDDVADVAVAVLTQPGHDGATYDVTGGESLRMADVAEQFARVAGRPVSYEDETIEQAWASRSSYGAPDWEVEGWISSYLAIGAGDLDVMSDVVPRLTGHPAQDLEGFLRAHPESWAHLRA